MGLPAVDRTRHASRPRLRIVRPKKKSRRASAAVRADRLRRLFQMSVLLMLCAAVFGLGRVMISTQAAEASFDSNRLEQEIKAERLQGDLLEVDKSALTTPSRIEQIAGETLKMSAASDVSYMCLPGVSAEEQPGHVDPVAVEEIPEYEDALTALFSSVMEMSAGEAQVLIVGDVGLASSR